eukprot:TRINITY_DN3203_c0_g1_i1.p1 TRINITY_DN3203_c0_g1~~TRINITY_DN3203_c0_g1_i1.p1  ORF type:complete len:160 (-),score=17.56 TRINITY_DN3203_c0_g1_i1:116-595(-)
MRGQEKIREEEENRRKIDGLIKNKTLRAFQEAELLDGPVAKPDSENVFLKDLTAQQIVELNMEIPQESKQDDNLSDEASSFSSSVENPISSYEILSLGTSSSKSISLPLSKPKIRRNVLSDILPPSPPLIKACSASVNSKLLPNLFLTMNIYRNKLKTS